MVSSILPSGRGAAIYHVIYENESLQTARSQILNLLKKAQHDNPGVLRLLYLDIDARRGPGGQFVPEVRVFVTDFLRGFVSRFVSEISVAGSKIHAGVQSDNIPDSLPPV